MWLYEIIGDTLPMCQNTTMRVNGAWVKRYCVLCSNTYITPCTVVITSLLVPDKPLEAPASVKRVYCFGCGGQCPHIFEIHEWQYNRSDPRKITNVPIFFNGMGHLSPFLQSLGRTLGLVTPYGDIDLGPHWLRQWLVTWQHQAITWINVD